MTTARCSYPALLHPPRGTPETWDSWFALARKNGSNMVQVYVFWNFHEPVEGQIDWSGRANLTDFVRRAASAGLFVNLRIGPYVCAEWTYGGIRRLGLKPGVAFRQTNKLWQDAMEKWFALVVRRMAEASLFATSGGPIVLVQVENELQPTDKDYVAWCGAMAARALAAAGASVPVTMCNGETANSTINTCNGNDCSDFLEKHGQSGRILVDQPALWTENEGGFQVWGVELRRPARSPTSGAAVADQALSVMKWFARGGSHMDYYMGRRLELRPVDGRRDHDDVRGRRHRVPRRAAARAEVRAHERDARRPRRGGGRRDGGRRAA